MLEVRDLCKVYTPKKGMPVTAINHINLRFPDAGMVFLLGKSGSGKSTLLNLLGGLDACTSGDILMKGVSSKAFKQQDFDSYRNTYVGFIFQEYNILEEFTVGANIALALELQGKKATDERINEILREVDLTDYGNRKPNELSGGQKQRVAIARALIKNPEIIMADEPTGALDSATGKQVFDTLKKLSKDKLVIIVSHDREFSEQYADRIIELADGNVISDVELDLSDNTESEEVQVGETGLTYDKNQITIEAGYHLTEEDRLAINAYMDQLEKEEKLVLTKKAHRCHDVRFKPTDESKIKKQDGQGFCLVKSRLPMKNAIKMGASGLKYKKFRLVMTVLLSCIAFVLFGLADTFGSYDHIKTCTQSIQDSDVNYVAYWKNYAVVTKDDEGKDKLVWTNNIYTMTEADLSRVEEGSGVEMKGIFVPRTANLDIQEYNDEAELGGDFYCSYIKSFNGYVEIDETELSDYGCELVAGRMPDGNCNEIAISAYACETFIKAGYSTDGKNYETIHTYKDMVGKTLVLDRTTYTITGIIDTGADFERYAIVNRNMAELSQAERILYFALNQELGYLLRQSMTGSIMVGKGDMNRLVLAQPDEKILDNYFIVEINEQMYMYPGYATTLSEVIKHQGKVHWIGEEKTELGAHEIIIPIASLDFWGDIVPEEELMNSSGIVIHQYIGDTSIEWDDWKIVGYFEESDENSIWENGIVVNDKTLSELSSDEGGIYSFAVGAMPESAQGIRQVVEFGETKLGTVAYGLANAVTYELSLVNDTLQSMARIFFFVGLGFAIFAGVMLGNFIATSIHHKKQDIGILRAIGSRGNDVFRIFFSESLIIALMNFVLSAVGVFAATQVINYYIRSRMGLLITVLSFGVRQVILLLVISVVVAAIASFIPVKHIAIKRPIDAIRNH